MDKRWVFRELAKKENGELSAVGLVAYALYKAQKDELASSLREEGKEEDEIQKELEIFHDTTVRNKRAQKLLIEKAIDVISNATDVAVKAQTENLQKQFDDLKKKLDNEHSKRLSKLQRQESAFKKHKEAEIQRLRKEEVDKLVDLAGKYKKPEGFADVSIHLIIKFLMWLWNGLGGLVALVLVGTLMFGIVAKNADEQTQNRIIKHWVEWVAGSLLTDPLPTIETGKK